MPARARTRALASALLLSALAAPGIARAELPASGARIRTHDYAIDLSQTPVLSSTRVTGLGGAFVAIGEGLDGTAQNPAAAAFRSPWSRDHFDYELGLGFMTSKSVSNSDLFNSGRRVRETTEDERFVFVNVALALQFGRWGFAVTTDLQEYALEHGVAPAGGRVAERLVAEFSVTHAIAAYAFHDNQILIGAGQRSIALDVVNDSDGSGSGSELFGAFGLGFEAGLLIRPNDRPFRIGASVRSSVTAEASPSSRERILYDEDPDSALFLPDRVTLPWSVNAGLALQLGPRPLNPRFIDPLFELEELDRFLAYRERERERRRDLERRRARTAGLDPEAAVRSLDAELDAEATLDALHRERAARALDRKLEARYRALSRHHVLLTASLEVLGPVNDAVGIEAFLERRVQRSGRRPSLSPRFGVETEPIPNFLKLRAGTYLEPTRFDDNPDGSRLHATLGLDQRLLEWNVFGAFPDRSVFRVSGSIDVARDYFSWGAGVGVWH